jgi:hypothetical protein
VNEAYLLVHLTLYMAEASPMDVVENISPAPDQNHLAPKYPLLIL